MSIFKWGVLLVALLVGAVALGAGVATAHDSGTEVRITAMRLDDGRIEFALQERDGEGWGERILPRGRFFPTTSSGRWLNSTPITVGVVEGMEESAAPPTPTATATPTPTTTATTDLVVTNYEWQASTSPFDGGIDDVTALATVTNNTGQTLTEWSAEMRCFDSAGVLVADDEVSSYSLIAIAHGEALRVQFRDFQPSGAPTDCSLSFRGELTLATTDLVVTNYEWQTSTSPFGGGLADVTASATVTNNTGQTLTEWSAAMRCTDTGVIVADDQLSSYSLSALAHGESARVQFRDLVPRGVPTDCELSFRGELNLTH